jgi:hypothetical protein
LARVFSDHTKNILAILSDCTRLVKCGSKASALFRDGGRSSIDEKKISAIMKGNQKPLKG